jgi:hypothetical protein
MKNIRIFIATPMYNNVCFGEYTHSLIQLLSELNKNNIYYFYRFLYNESDVTRARDNLAHEFLKTDCTHILFLDNDIVFNHLDILKMINLNKDFICGVYPKKKINFLEIEKAVKNNIPVTDLLSHTSEYVFYGEKNQHTFKKDNNGLINVNEAGTGYMLLNKKVFKKIDNNIIEYTNNSLFPGEKTKHYFGHTICERTNHLLVDDFGFCKRWKDVGGHIYVATWAKARHIGNFTF